MNESNEEKLKKWNKYCMFSGNILNEESIRDVLLYMMRSLSRGRIPDKILVAEILEDKKDIPVCGYIGCHIECEHIH